MEPKNVVTRYAEEGLNGELVSDVRLRQRDGFLRAAFPDLELHPRVIIGEGALVAGHFSARGTHLGLYHGVPPSGRRWEAACTAVYRVADGRIADAWVTWDQLALLEQLGAIERAATVSA
jgi:predicted ester cyclase